jgi:hypothetical protein
MKTNSLKYKQTFIKDNGEQLVVNIRLDDQCENGHQEFAITADLYKDAGRSDRHCIAGGCIHDEILKIVPQFKIFVDLHLCDYKGIPMFAIANGFYHMEKGFNNITKSFKEDFCEYYRITPEQFDVLQKCKTQDQYALELFKMDVFSQWEKEANEAIGILERLTGDEFIVDSVRTQLDTRYDKECMEKLINLDNEGYFSEELVAQRFEEEQIAKRKVKLDNINEAYHKKVAELKADLYLDIIGIELFNTTENVIYYKHTDEVVMNWQDNIYSKKYTEEEYKAFQEACKKYPVFNDTKFTLK